MMFAADSIVAHAQAKVDTVEPSYDNPFGCIEFERAQRARCPVRSLQDRLAQVRADLATKPAGTKIPREQTLELVQAAVDVLKHLNGILAKLLDSDLLETPRHVFTPSALQDLHDAFSGTVTEAVSPGHIDRILAERFTLPPIRWVDGEWDGDADAPAQSAAQACGDAMERARFDILKRNLLDTSPGGVVRTPFCPPTHLDVTMSLADYAEEHRTRPTPEVCDLPPLGWICTRAAGHDGPCASRKDV